MAVEDTDLLRRILEVQSKSKQTGAMRRFLVAELAAMGAHVSVHKRNVYAVKGQADVYPCQVAHLDTVHAIIPSWAYSVQEQEGTWFGWDYSRDDYTGVGGDDKCGIYVALMCLRELPACKVVFLRDEECGMQGAREVDLRFFDNCAFVLEADRTGKDEFVRRASGTELYGDEFSAAIKPILEQFGRKEILNGGGTDVMTMKEIKPDGLKIACANMCTGYFFPHTKKETIELDALTKTVELCLALHTQLAYRRWEHAWVPKWQQPAYQSGSYQRSHTPTGTTTPTVIGKVVGGAGSTSNPALPATTAPETSSTFLKGRYNTNQGNDGKPSKKNKREGRKNRGANKVHAGWFDKTAYGQLAGEEDPKVVARRELDAYTSGATVLNTGMAEFEDIVEAGYFDEYNVPCDFIYLGRIFASLEDLDDALHGGEGWKLLCGEPEDEDIAELEAEEDEPLVTICPRCGPEFGSVIMIPEAGPFCYGCEGFIETQYEIQMIGRDYDRRKSNQRIWIAENISYPGAWTPKRSLPREPEDWDAGDEDEEGCFPGDYIFNQFGQGRPTNSIVVLDDYRVSEIEE